MQRKYWAIWGTVIMVMAMILSGCAAPADAPAAEADAGGDAEAAVPPITILINDSPWFPGFEALVNRYIDSVPYRKLVRKGA